MQSGRRRPSLCSNADMMGCHVQHYCTCSSCVVTFVAVVVASAVVAAVVTVVAAVVVTVVTVTVVVREICHAVLSQFSDK